LCARCEYTPDRGIAGSPSHTYPPAMLHWRIKLTTLALTAVVLASAVGSFSKPFDAFGFFW